MLRLVAEEPVLQRPLRLERRVGERLPGTEHLPLHDVDVEVAVVVDIDQADAGSHDLRVVELPRHAVEVGERQARVRRRLDEPWRAATAGVGRGFVR
jgi:hypothetical protein